jgi:hypothetical protein
MPPGLHVMSLGRKVPGMIWIEQVGAELESMPRLFRFNSHP